MHLVGGQKGQKLCCQSTYFLVITWDIVNKPNNAVSLTAVAFKKKIISVHPSTCRALNILQTSQIPYGEDSSLRQRPKKVKPRQVKRTGDAQQMQEQSPTKAPSFTPSRGCSQSTAPLCLLKRNKRQPLALGQTSCAQVDTVFHQAKISICLF